MSVHYEEPCKRWVIRFRDGDGKQRCVTANALNFAKYELPVPERITARTVRRLEAEVLRRETAADGSIRSVDRRKMMYLDVVARYIPPLLSTEGKDVWEERPLGQNLENERTYSILRVQHMILVLTRYFPAFLDTGKIRWRRNGRRKHDRVAKVHTCTRRIDSITCENVAGFQIYLTNSGLASATVRGYVTTLRSFFSWCTERGYMMTNPAGGIKLPSRKKREVKWLDMSLPILNGKTPRQACKTEAGRQKVAMLIRTTSPPAGNASTQIDIPRQEMFRSLGLESE